MNKFKHEERRNQVMEHRTSFVSFLGFDQVFCLRKLKIYFLRSFREFMNRECCLMRSTYILLASSGESEGGRAHEARVRGDL